MIVRRIAARHGRQAFASAIPRTCTRFISQDTSTTGLTMDAIESITADAAADKFDADPERAARRREARFLSQTSPVAEDDAVKSWRDYQEYRKTQGSIGSVVRRENKPLDLLASPPSAANITLELLMASQTHMGHHTSRWNPGNARYIYGVRQDTHIISLETTAAHLRRAARVVEEVAYRGGLMLFVGTRKGQMEIVTRTAKMAGACQLFTRWTPGMITNRDVIQQYSKAKMVNEKDEPVEGFEDHARDRRALVPDLVVCLNPLENKTLLYECGLAAVPTIGIIDTNADPSLVTYTIPANDDSMRSVALIAGVLGRAGEAGQKRRLEEAEDGQAQWETPEDTKRFRQATFDRWRTEHEKWSADMAAMVASGASPEDGNRLLDVNEVSKQTFVGGAAASAEARDEAK